MSNSTPEPRCFYLHVDIYACSQSFRTYYTDKCLPMTKLLVYEKVTLLNVSNTLYKHDGILNYEVFEKSELVYCSLDGDPNGNMTFSCHNEAIGVVPKHTRSLILNASFNLFNLWEGGWTVCDRQWKTDDRQNFPLDVSCDRLEMTHTEMISRSQTNGDQVWPITNPTNIRFSAFKDGCTIACKASFIHYNMIELLVSRASVYFEYDMVNFSLTRV
jgi:hypothetical protein